MLKKIQLWGPNTHAGPLYETAFVNTYSCRLEIKVNVCKEFAGGLNFTWKLQAINRSQFVDILINFWRKYVLAL